MPRMRQINTTATDLLRGNVRQGHYSVVIGRKKTSTHLSFRSFIFWGKKWRTTEKSHFCRDSVRSDCPVTTHSGKGHKKPPPHMWTAVFLNSTRSSGDCTAAKSKKGGCSQWCSLSSPAWKGRPPEQGRLTQDVAPAASL